jgi:hypothetical protein
VSGSARLHQVLATNAAVMQILERAPALELSDWYLGAGGVAQTVWNDAHGFAPEHGIKDYDLVYFAPEDLSEAAEAEAAGRARELFTDLDVALDVKNEARVHLWYEQRFGHPCPRYSSSADAIATWPTTATAVGVRTTGGALQVCAPFGLDDLFALVVRPNTALIGEAIYTAKVRRWRAVWPRLHIAPWPD